MALSPELRAELANLTAAVRAQLEVEAELGAVGLRVEMRTTVPSRAPERAVSGVAPRMVAQQSTPVASAIEAPVPAPADVNAGDRGARLQLLADGAESCKACVLHEKRTRSVFARGSPDAELVFVGEGPGRDEDLQGYPFVGAAGQLLDRMIVAMGYARDDVYVCNVVKCRPPENRTPRPEEAIACSKFLVPQLEIVAPKIIVALGRCAAQALGVAQESGPWRGRWGAWHGVSTMPTYHPAFLLRSPEFKRTVWEDLQQVMARLGREPARRST